MITGVSSEILCSGVWCLCSQVHTCVYRCPSDPNSHSPPSTYIFLCSHHPLPRPDASSSQKLKGHHEPDPRSAVPRHSQVSVGAMPESWLYAPEAKVSQSVVGWWE